MFSISMKNRNWQDADLCLFVENKISDTFSICWNTECHVPGHGSSPEPQGSSRPRPGLKPNSAQAGPYPHSLEEVVLSEK